MTNICDMCEQEFGDMTIRVIIPIWANGNRKEIHLCRPCFLKTDNMTAQELINALNQMDTLPEPEPTT